ncbi:MAG: transporter [Desulfobacterales bacterium]|jgi:hypothetical protein|nr:transporter [Desulfobacterales bacterium]
MKSGIRLTRLWAFFATLAIILSFSGPALAVDDGARAYWKGRDGTNVVSFQYLNLNMQASGTQQFDPAHFIYPNADTEANVMIANYARHLTLFNRASSLAVNLVGGSVDLDVNTNFVPPSFLPPGVSPGDSLHQSASGFADPSVQLDVNLFGTSPLKSTVDLVNYEPTWTIDAAVLLAFPIGQYDKDKLVNMGLNRWYGRFALPIKYHFGAFTPGYRWSFELTPSVWLFAENDDFVGQKLENDPLWQIEAHLTHDFTEGFFGSLDLLYRGGFQSEINGVDVGDKLDVGDLGFTLNYQVTDNITIRTSYSSNVFGDSNLDSSIIRIQFVYGWHRLMENMKKLKRGH